MNQLPENSLRRYDVTLVTSILQEIDMRNADLILPGILVAKSALS